MDRSFPLSRPDGHTISCYHWTNGKEPRAVLVVAHGMGEHALRYRPALDRLIGAGIALYALDHRGHGATMKAASAEAGDFGAGGFEAVVADLAALVEKARAENPGVPLLLLGHSMGSFIAQAFLVDHGALIDGAVLVGTTAVDLLGAAMAQESDALAALNRPFEPARTPCDWLSRDTDQVDLYINDPLCGFALVPQSMVSLLSEGERLADPDMLARIPAGLPLYIIVGERDVLITDFGRLQPLVDRYRAVGLDPSVVIYPGARHEILNETNRDEVVSDLLGWLDSQIAAARAHAPS